MDIQAIHATATAAAEKAAADTYARIGERDACGFAWVEVFNIKLNTRIGKQFAALGFSKGYGRGAGIHLWNPSRHHTQSISVKEAGAVAYAAVLKEHGFTAYAASRLD
jgi:hypothetical protein